MKFFLLILSLSLLSFNAHASTWCTISNFDVGVSGNYVYVISLSLNSDEKHVFVADLNTVNGKAIHGILLAAALSGKSVKYGDNSKDWACGALPAYTSETAHPGYLNIMTREES